MLGKYRQKRDFSRTPEPQGREAEGDRDRPLFCVQKHSARHLHYDFRLEAGGVLRSWAVPQGPSLDPSVKRLAVQVEDHPRDYASFEGVIPEGHYGAGQVIVWDSGTYYPDDMEQADTAGRGELEEYVLTALDKGKLSISLQGYKLNGSFALVHMKEKNWLLIKHRDKHADETTDVLKQGQSVLSGLTIEALQRGETPPARATAEPSALEGARKAALPRSISPMLAMPAEKPFSAPGWVFEPKIDGIRAIAVIEESKIRLYSRRGHEITGQYPGIVRDLAALSLESAVIDGEISALDEEGRPSFQRLQSRINLSSQWDIERAEGKTPAYYFIFDLLYYGGYDLQKVRLLERKEILAKGVIPSGHLRLLDYYREHGESVYAEAIKYGFEGVLAKKEDGTYRQDYRSRHWLKVKRTSSDDFVICGYTEGQGSRAGTFGSLLLGYYDTENRLVYAGNVGSGFDEASQAAIKEKLSDLETGTSPFAKKPDIPDRITWVKPSLVAEVKFSEWTHEGRLRSPVFLHLRPDKPPQQARPVREVDSSSKGDSETDEGATGGDAAAQLAGGRKNLTLKVDGYSIPVTNLDKVLWPAGREQRALSKRDLLIYLAQISPYVLPHLRDRPLTLSRYPDGINGEQFFQKRWNDPLPKFVHTARLRSEHAGGTIDYILCNNRATLLWLGQIADLELHTWFSRVAAGPDMQAEGSGEKEHNRLVQYPDFIIFDIDPYIYAGSEKPGQEPQLNKKAFAKGRDAALWLKEKLDELSLASFVKTSGKTGIHIYVPLVRRLRYDAVRRVAGTIAGFVLREHSDIITLEWSTEKRRGKIFLDVNQNVKGKTLAAPYSPRPVAGACVSMPLAWEELGETYPTAYTMLNVPDILRRRGDHWAGMMQARNDLEALLKGGL